MEADHYACVEGDDLDTETACRLIVGCVVPRPVEWITTIDDNGRVNAAPFSSYNYVAYSTGRSLLRSLVFGAAAACLASGIQAQNDATYPSRVVTLINPYAPGGPADTLGGRLRNSSRAD
jgi:hypothetical protein